MIIYELFCTFALSFLIKSKWQIWKEQISEANWV